MVLHGQRHGVPRVGQQHRDGHSCRAGLGGILHQVAQQVQQQVRIAVHHSPALGRQQRHLGAGHPQPRPQVGQVHRGKLQPFIAQRKQRQQLVAQRLQAAALVVDGPSGLVLLGGVDLQGAQHIGVADDRGHRRLQLVGERAHKVLPPLDIHLQIRDLFLHSIGHFVKALADVFQLVAGMQGSAAVVVAACDLRAGGPQNLQRAGHLAGQQCCDQGSRRQHHSLQPQKAPHRRGAGCIQRGQVVGRHNAVAALQLAGKQGVGTPAGPHRRHGAVRQRGVYVYRDVAADKLLPLPQGGRLLVQGQPRGRHGAVHLQPAALAVQQVGLHVGADLAVPGGVSGQNGTALHGKIAVQQPAPAQPKGRTKHQHQQADHLVGKFHHVPPGPAVGRSSGLILALTGSRSGKRSRSYRPSSAFCAIW